MSLSSLENKSDFFRHLKIYRYFIFFDTLLNTCHQPLRRSKIFLKIIGVRLESSGANLTGVVDPYPAYPDRYQVQANGKVVKFNLFHKISIYCQNTENYHTFDPNEKDELLYTGNDVSRSKKKYFDFPTCVKLGVGSA
jgi:hypothetical protein